MPRASYLQVLQVSAAHVYLTYPFVLSWSLLEAMACGADIVASDTAPVREVLRNGANARLVGFHDDDAIAQAVLESLSNPDGAAQRRHQARADAQRFDQPSAITHYEGLLSQAANS